MKVYFAGGWFSPAQEEEHTRVGNFLERHKNLSLTTATFAERRRRLSIAK